MNYPYLPINLSFGLNWLAHATQYLFFFIFFLFIFIFVHAMSYRGLDPVVLPSAASQAVKMRLINFVRSLSTVLAFAYILTRCTCYILRKTLLFVSCSFIDSIVLK
jgi:hypothetical protein